MPSAASRSACPRAGYHDGQSHINLAPACTCSSTTRRWPTCGTRHGVGSGPDAGGDLPRIELQQAFISSVVQKVNQQGLLSNIPDLLSIANIATKALTVDKGLGSVSSLLHLARVAGRT